MDFLCKLLCRFDYTCDKNIFLEYKNNRGGVRNWISFCTLHNSIAPLLPDDPTCPIENHASYWLNLPMHLYRSLAKQDCCVKQYKRKHLVKHRLTSRSSSSISSISPLLYRSKLAITPSDNLSWNSFSSSLNRAKLFWPNSAIPVATSVYVRSNSLITS